MNGIFKNFVVKGKNLKIDEIEIPYLKLTSVTDYNWIDYKAEPMVYKSDMTFLYEMDLTEDSINSALKHKFYYSQLLN